MSFNPSICSATPAQRFGLIIRGLLGSVGARATQNLLTGGYPGVGMAKLPWPMSELIGARFRRAGRLFAALAERVRLGTARTFPNRASPSTVPPSDTPPRDQPTSAQPTPDAPDPAAGEKLPRGFGGVLGLLHWEAAHYADQLRRELADPEMVALLQSVPGFARIVRPLCRMLAVVPPPGLFAPLPRRQRRSPRTTDTPPTPSQHSAASPPSAKAPGGGQDRAGIWTRPRPMAWETRLDARVAGAARKTS